MECQSSRRYMSNSGDSEKKKKDHLLRKMSQTSLLSRKENGPSKRLSQFVYWEYWLKLGISFEYYTAPHLVCRLQ